MQQSRLFYLDALRGIAAVIVVLVHYFAAFYPYSVFGPAAGPARHAWENIFFSPPFGLLLNGHLAVCLFFILSGFVLSYRYLGKSGDRQALVISLIKRPIRLGGLVLLSILVSAALWNSGLYFNHSIAALNASGEWFQGFWSGELNLSNLLATVSTALFRNGYIYNPPLWTIRIELYGSAMAIMFLLLFKEAKFRCGILVVLLFLFRNSLYQGFWLGIILADSVQSGFLQACFSPHRRWLKYGLTGIVAALFIYLCAYPHYADSGFLPQTIYRYLPNDAEFGGGYPMLTAFCTFVLVCSNRRIQGWLNQPWLLFLGKISYGIYIIHFLILGSLSSWILLTLHQHGISYELSFFVTLVSGCGTIGITAYGATKLIDSPCIRLAQYVGRKLQINLNYAQSYTAKMLKLPITNKSA